MNKEQWLNITEDFLSAWNSQEVKRVLNCYTEDCLYRDPNTNGFIRGHESFGRYLTKLFQNWNMHWITREFFPFCDEEGGGFLWHAKITPASGGKTTEVDGMDLVLLKGKKLCRNDVYFDRMGLPIQ